MKASSPQRPGSSLDQRRRSASGNGGGRMSIGASGRTSIGAGGSTNARTSIGHSGIPRAGMGASRISAMRAATTQPSFDFLTGGEARDAGKSVGRLSSQATRERGPSSNENLRAAAENAELIELKAEVKTLKYTLSTLEQEQELAKLRQESEMRETRRKGDEDFKKMQHAEGERNKAVRLYEELMKELGAIRDAATNEKASLERRVREVEDGKRLAEEEVEDFKADTEEKLRSLERKLREEESKNAGFQGNMIELQQENQEKEIKAQELQQALVQRESEIGSLESEVLRLKAHTGDADTLGVIKRELSEQVAHIRSLEATNREQAAELKHLRRLHKGIEVVEEEKRALQRKVDSIEGLQQELGEARLQRQRLEDERLAWTAYLQSQAAEDGPVEFESPEAIARALVQERLETATLLEKLGGLEPAISEREAIIKNMESEKAKLASQIEKLKTNGGGDFKARTRLERQRTLALKEVEYLRAQLKTFDSEESTMELQSYDEKKAIRIQQLEDMVAKYSDEVKALHDELAAAVPNPAPPSESGGSKRARDDSEDHEQFGQLSRKNRKLQDELSTLQSSAELLKKELSVTQERLKAASQQNKTRILSLRSNPTSEVEAIKTTTLTTLRAENTALLSQLRSGNPNTQVVPISTLEAKQLELKEMTALVADTKKSMARLKQVWGAKTAEFREGVNSLLGWKVDFMPNGKMKVTSLFYPSSEDSENSIVFDGEQGTMKVSGGPRSLFALKISDQIKFWLTERGEIPCLLAALTLEFYEESTRAARH